MNERIQAIKNQCWVERHWDNDKELMIDGHIDLDRFAELVVKECADIVDRAVGDGGVDGRVVKEHFGIEE